MPTKWLRENITLGNLISAGTVVVLVVVTVITIQARAGENMKRLDSLEKRFESHCETARKILDADRNGQAGRDTRLSVIETEIKHINDYQSTQAKTLQDMHSVMNELLRRTPK